LQAAVVVGDGKANDNFGFPDTTPYERLRWVEPPVPRRLTFGRAVRRRLRTSLSTFPGAIEPTNLRRPTCILSILFILSPPPPRELVIRRDEVGLDRMNRIDRMERGSLAGS